MGRIALVALPLLFLCLLVFLLRPTPASRLPAAGDAFGDSAAAPSPRGLVLDSGGDPQERTERAEASTATAGVAAPEAVASDEPPGGFRGRLVFQDGSAAVGATVWAHAAGWEKNRPGTVDETGAFEVRFVVEPEVEYGAAAWMENHAQVSWSGRQGLPGGEVVDLGEAVLVPAGDLRVRLVDESGAPYASEMGLSADPGGVRMRGGPGWNTPGGTYSPELGSLLFSSLPAGRRSVTGVEDGARAEGSAEVRQGEETGLTLTVEVEDRSSAIRVSVDVGVYKPLESQALRAVQLMAEAGGERFEGLAGVFEGLRPGSYTALVEAQGFLPERRSGLRPGDEVEVGLTGGCSIALEVVEAGTGRAIEAYGVQATFPKSGTSAMNADLVNLESPLADGLLEQVPAVPMELRVYGAAGAEAIVVLDDLQVGQLRNVRAELALPSRLELLVTGETSGAPRGDVYILVRRVLARGDGRMSLGQLDVLGEGLTDAGGGVAFERVPRLPLEVLAQAPGSVGPVYLTLEPEALDGSVVTVAVPEAGEVFGEVLNLPPGEGWMLAILPMERAAGGGAMPWRHVFGRGVRVPLDAEGRFGPLELQPGAYRVALPTGELEEPWEELAWVLPQVWLAGQEQTVRVGVENRWSIDAAAGLPARLSLEVLLDGRPMARAGVRLEPIEQQGAALNATLDGAGRLEAQEVTPGRYQVSVSVVGATADTTLHALLEPDLGVAPDSNVVRSHSLVSVRRELQLVLPPGHEQAGQASIQHLVGGAEHWAYGINLAGGLSHEIWAGSGRYRVELGWGPPDAGPTAEFDLAEGAGPLVIELSAQED